ncbi:MAG TPA: ABC transporter permease, partial [Candidatus Acidoferrales bacterium]|nr:ABC transporter permease [Candidatus Acidoferrales bacterium]
RMLRKSPGFTTVALLTLAFAIGANTAIFSVVNAVLIRSTPYKEPNRIAVVLGTNSLTNTLDLNTSVPNFEDWRSRSRTFENLAGYRESDAAFIVNGEPDWIEFAWVYGDFFALFGRSPVLGRTFGSDEPNPHAIVISHRMWESRFGESQGVIGKTVMVGGVDFQVIGVMPEDFSFPLRETEFWAPATALPNWQSIRATRRGGFFSVAGRLRPGVTLQQARAEMTTISHQLEAAYPVENQYKRVNIVPLAALVNGTTIPFMLMVLFGAVVFVLLIASANVANLLLARGAARAQEFAVRMALGAARTRLLRQLLTESVLLSGAAGLLALPIAAWSVRALIAIAPQKLARLADARIDAGVLVFGLILSLATGIIFGLIPAIRISRDAGRRSHTTGVHARGLRRTFVVAEVALAVVLVTGAGLLIRSFAALQSVDPGFQTQRVIAATLRFRNDYPRDRRYALYQEAMTRLAQVPGVSAVGGVSTMFFSGERNKFGLRAVEGKPEEKQTEWTEMTWATVSGDYFQALGVPLLRGRFFNEGDTAGKSPVVIINQTMAHRYWPDEDPIGKGLKGFDARGHNDEWVRVIGVVGDMRSNGLERKPMAQLYETQMQSHDETEDLVVRTSASANVLRDAVRSVDKAAVLLNVSTLEGRLRAQTAPRRFQMLLVSIFAALALALAASGIFRMMHFAVAQRTREIGIRMAMGARPANVVSMVLREGFLLTAIGTAIGLAGSFSLARSMRSLLFEVSAADPVTLCAVASGLGLVALLACYLPAHHATRIDPMVALRCE